MHRFQNLWYTFSKSSIKAGQIPASGLPDKGDLGMKHCISWDCHMHSSFSSDSDSDMEDMIKSAVKKGLDGVCFTEHFDPDYPPTPDGLEFSLDIPAYRARLCELKEKYKNQICVRFGIELGLQPHLQASLPSLVREFPFDFVIGSSHLVHGYDPYYPEFFQNRGEARCYREYFESILENLNAFSCMDVYGHIDYIVRYGPNKNRFYSFQAYEDILTAILEKIIQKRIGIELNTGGFACGLGQPNPCEEVLLAYRRLGGKIITIGADAHTPDRAAFAFDRAAHILRTCGFTHYTVFDKREPVFLPLL